jgi:hypothetical protein
MVAALDVRQKQHSVTERLSCENETLRNIYKKWKTAFGDDAVDRSTVIRYARRLSGESGHVNIRHSPRTSRRNTAQTPSNVQHVSDMVLEDKRVTLKEMSLKLGIEETSVCGILKQLG